MINEGNWMQVGRNEPCPCGSGKKFKHCHATAQRAAPKTSPTSALFSEAQRYLQQGDHASAMDRYRRILEMDPEHADARHYLGMALCFEGDRVSGLAHIRASLAMHPQDAVYHNNLALWLEEENDMETAEQHFVRAVTLVPDYREARLHLASLLLRRRRHQAVRMTLEQFVRQHPADSEASQLLIDALFHLGEYAVAQTIYRDLLRRKPKDRTLRLNLAKLLQSIGHDAEAQVECDAVLAADPKDLAALRLQASIAERCNRLDEAEQWTQAALTQDTGDGITLRLLARIKRRQGHLPAALALLEKVDVATLPLPEQAFHYKECGTVLDKLARHAEAFEAFRAGNAAARQVVETETGQPFYEADKVSHDFDTHKRFFTRERVAGLAPYVPAANRPAPLFIVGFPRSGTTLVEQMLGVHPHIHAGGELQALYLLETSATSRLGNARPYPECLEAVRPAERAQALCRLRDDYLALAREAGAVGAAAWFTDKMPLNETRLGLVRLLFPDSPVVHMIRHPLDVVLSCYMNELTHGNNCALDIETTAFHYSQVMQLAEQYVTELGLHTTRLRYEDLLDNPEGEMRRLFEFIGEPWDARCLEFHRAARVARTASYAQVAQPLYSTSRERWRAYRRQLEPVIPLLRPLMTRLGYSAD
jgi:tetratricopeptide (TPR) repeat protein